MNEYEERARTLFDALQKGDDAAQWRFKWEHPRFKGKTIHEVRAATLTLDDARTVVAREESFNTWDELNAFTRDEFEDAVDALVNGEADTLRALLARYPDLVRRRSKRRHHCTLLHYLGANGVEGWRQKTPANAIEMATMLLDAGAEPDALADLYDEKCTTMGMLVSSTHPHEAGLQGALAELLLNRGAQLEGPGTDWQSAVLTALIFGYLDTARMLAARSTTLNLAAAAGLGRAEETAKLLPGSDEKMRHMALALAAQLGHVDVVRLLLDAGEDPDRYNPDGYHSHATPLHHAALSNHLEVVKLLVERGARLDMEDKLYDATPLGWAEHGQCSETAEYLRSVSARS